MAGEYPKRDKLFAIKVCRLLMKTCAAQELGPMGALLVSYIASQEDAAHYRRPVTFFDYQLMPIVGAPSQKVLATARAKCVSKGWLHYEHGRKGVAGKYFVTIPDHATGLDNAPSDEGFIAENDYESASNLPSNGEEMETERRSNGDESATERRSNGQPLLPVPRPSPEDDFFSREDANPNRTRLDQAKADSLTFSPSEKFKSIWSKLPTKLQTGQSGIWSIWPDIVEIAMRRHSLDFDAAEDHIFHRIVMFAQSDKGRRANYQWSSETFFRSGHYDDPPESWELATDKKKPRGESDLFGSLKRNKARVEA